MRSVTVFCLVLALGAPAFVGAQAEKPETLEGRFSYGIGLNLARNLTAQGIAVDVELIAQGMRDALGSGPTLLTNEEIEAAMQTMQTQVQQKMQAQMAALATKNASEGKAFLDGNAGAEGVVVRPSGLQYKVLEAGSGPMPSASDTVRVHYEGRLIDGTVFDSSYKRGEPAEFSIGGVIQGWIEAIPLMSVGAKWQLFIPSAMAYGERGQGPVIGPNSVLIFDVELLEIVSASDG